MSDERHPLWHERRRWVVMVAHPGTDVQRQEELADWADEPMSRECLDSMSLHGVPLHVELRDFGDDDGVVELLLGLGELSYSWEIKTGDVGGLD